MGAEVPSQHLRLGEQCGLWYRLPLTLSIACHVPTCMARSKPRTALWVTQGGSVDLALRYLVDHLAEVEDLYDGSLLPR